MPRQETLKAAVCRPEVAGLAPAMAAKQPAHHTQVLVQLRSRRKLRQAYSAGVQPTSQPI